MALKSKVTVKFTALDSIKKYLRDKGDQETGEVVISEMKKAIASGLSPVRNFGRFEEYAAQKKGWGYPLSVKKQFPDKSLRPVNLKLSGDMLDSLDTKKTKGGVEVGVFAPDQAQKAKKHQAGDPGVNLPQRRFIPARKGEEFIVTITRAIRDSFAKAVDRALKRG